jgi:hypothetical protein
MQFRPDLLVASLGQSFRNLHAPLLPWASNGCLIGSPVPNIEKNNAGCHRNPDRTKSLPNEIGLRVSAPAATPLATPAETV